MTTVACVLRSGGQYTPEWVQKLANGVAQHIGEHRFVCLSDVSVNGVETIPLRWFWPRWWAKLELFRPGLFTGPVVYFDLDTIVTGSVEALLRPIPKGIAMVRDFYQPQLHNSSCMVFIGDHDHSKLVSKFSEDPEGHVHVYDKMRPRGRIGDQAFIEDNAVTSMLPDGLIVSYKKGSRQPPPPTATAVTFHGTPKPHEAGGWVKKIWESL